MSVIRCTSNPEGLYIWQSKEGRRLMADISWTQKAPLAKGSGMVVPWADFRKVVQGWRKYPADLDVERHSHGFSAMERLVFLDTGERLTFLDRDCDAPSHLGQRRPVSTLIRLADDQGHFVYLWGVTWAYVMQSFFENYT